MNWLHPQYFWLLVVIPLVAGLFVFAAVRRSHLASVFGDQTMVNKLASSFSHRRRRWKALLATTGLLFLVFALLGPRFGTRMREVQRQGIDLIIALDVSTSMMAEDVAPNRLERAKNEIRKVLDDLTGDRVGLVTFAGDAFIQCPLTTDYSAVRLFLDVADPSLIPTPGTDFGSALKMAMKAFRAPTRDNSDEPRTRAVLFVSDGENHVDDLETIVEKAREDNLILFSAGVGETVGSPIPLYSNGRRVDYKTDRQGKVVTTRLEEDALKSLAQDGSYFRIAKTSSSLSKITAALDRLDKTTLGTDEFEEYDEKYQWPLFIGILLLFGERLIPDRSRRPAEDHLEDGDQREEDDVDDGLV